MYLDIYSQLIINKKVMKLFGRDCAIYWSVLTETLNKAIVMKQLDSDNYISLDRAQLEDQTTLMPEEQYLCDSKLAKFEIVKIDANNVDRLYIYVNKMLAYISSEDTTVLEAIVKETGKTKAQKAVSKKEGMKKTMITAITSTDMDLVEAYRLWISALVDNKFLTKAQVSVFQKTVESYSTNKEVQLKVIELATVHCYVDASWAINLYEKSYRRGTQVVNPEKQQEKKAVDFSVSF